jgi:hypothetical protein
VKFKKLIGSAAIVAGLALAVQPAEARKPAGGKAAAAKDKREEKASKIPPGQLHIIVTLATQRVAVYSDGVLAARSNVATGVPGHPTPTGVFSIIGKSRHHASNIYSGAPMPFMQRVTWSGIAMHQGVVPGGRTASHGCIRLYADFASMMFNTTKIGARVIIAQNEVAPSEVAHHFLFTPKPAVVLAADEQKPVTPTKTAEAATGTATDAPPVTAAEPDAFARDMEAQEAKKELVQPNAPISVFVSAKEKKLFIRQNFLPIFDTPVTIKDTGQPLGTHVFTAVATAEPNKLRWLVVSVPDNLKPKTQIKTSSRNAKAAKDQKPAEPEKPAPTAAEALDRLELAAEVRTRIEEMMGAGASFIVSDRGLGDETGEGTDFVVLTR